MKGMTDSAAQLTSKKGLATFLLTENYERISTESRKCSVSLQLNPDKSKKTDKTANSNKSINQDKCEKQIKL